MRNTRVVGWAFGLLVVGLLAGCEMIVAELAMDFTLAVEPQQIEIAQGDSGQVNVQVSRTLPIDVLPTGIEVTLHDGPAGVTAADITIPSGIEDDDLVLVVASDAELGTHTIELWGSSGLKTKQATFELTIVEPHDRRAMIVAP